jgi:dihydropteroate synthase
MLQTVGNAKVPYIMMHMRGTPQTMKGMTSYENMLVEINHYFSERIAAARACGINDIIIDPGFGFAKTREQNFKLLSDLELLHAHQVPILAGVSRKSMIYKTLDITAQEALNGTTALHMACLLKGAKILRVHDVKEAVETIQLYKEIPIN